MNTADQLRQLDVLGASRIGRVESFDEPRGLGTLRESSGAQYDFHCSAIADGSRQIVAGAAVRFVLRAGNAGRLEADELIKVDPVG